MAVFDAHAHIYPEKIASKAVDAIGRFYGIRMAGGKGTPEDLIASGQKASVSRFLVHSTATSPEQVRAINDYIIGQCALHKEFFVGFGTLHPEMEDPAAEVEYMVAGGLKGVKLHPDFQKFSVDSPGLDRLYGAVSGKLPVLFHAGDSRYGFSNPSRIAAVAGRWPGLTIVAAHFGGYTEWEEAAKRLYSLPNVWFDTSSSLPFLGRERAVEMIRLAGADRFMFGSDYPMWGHAEELERFYGLPLGAEEREAILSSNMARLLDL